MRFLMDFVSCCGSADCETSNTREVSGSTAGGRRGRLEETRALVSVRGGRNRTRKRSRTGSAAAAGGGAGAGARPGAEGEWKPTLAAITEDKAAVVEEKARRAKERAAKRKASGGSGRGGSRDSSSSFHGEDYRGSGNQFAGVFPGFPAAPFMI